MENLSSALANVDNFDECYNYLDTLINHRNTLFPAFIVNDGGHNESTEVFETSTVEDTDLESERLRFEARALKDENENLKTSISIEEKRYGAELERHRKAANENKNKTKMNLQMAKDVRREKATYREDLKHVLLNSKQLADRIDFPKKAIKKFFKVSEQGLCQDVEFCKEFSGGKCISTSQCLNSN